MDDGTELGNKATWSIDGDQLILDKCYGKIRSYNFTVVDEELRLSSPDHSFILTRV